MRGISSAAINEIPWLEPMLLAPELVIPESVKDPATGAYPATLPCEIALRVDTPQAICEAYGISKEEWDAIRARPDFRDEVRGWVEKLKEEGMTFKTKARLQSEELLKTAWAMIHDRSNQVPATVRADLIKFIIRASGLDESAKGATAGGGGNQTALQININL